MRASTRKTAIGVDPVNDQIERLSIALVRGLRSVASFEAAFVLFIFAGVYKADPRVAWVPVDLTLLFFLVSIGTGFWVLFRRRFNLSRRGITVLLPIFGFLGWMICTLAWSPSIAYGPDKALQLGTLVLWAAIAPAMIIAPDPGRFNRFIAATLIFCTILSFDGLVSYFSGRGAVFSTDSYLNMGRTVGVGTMIAIVSFATSRTWVKRGTMLMLLPTLFFVLWVDGGRGPFLSAIIAIATLVFASFFRSKGSAAIRIVSSVAFMCLLGASVAIWLGAESRTLHRLMVFTSQESGGRSAEGRLEYLASSIEPIAAAPLLGVGLGGWPLATGRGDNQQYPHNIFVEIASEGGAVGLILFVIAIAVGLKSLPVRDAFKSQSTILILILFVYVFATTQSSWDISENRLLFTMLGLMAIKRPNPIF
jgi:hypothetical protein